MSAKLGHNPSYIWQSLLWSREMLEQGILWRVGDSKSISLFEDKWVPSLKSNIGHYMAPWTNEHKVCSLIKNGVWDKELILNNFPIFIADAILRIPLRATSFEDSRFWRFDMKGRYSVRDGCRLQSGLFETPVHQSVFPNEKWLVFLWNLSLP